MKLVPPQQNRAELLDLGHGSPREVRKSLRDLHRINRYLGGTRVVIDGVWELIGQAGIRDATLADIGTGDADIPIRMMHAAGRRGIELNVLALDSKRLHLQIARDELGGEKRIRLVQADAFRLPLADSSVDIVTTSLFLHHFRPPEIGSLLAEFERVCRIGWVMNDLVRHALPLAFFRLTRPIFAHSYLTRYDGQASLRRCYTIEEMRAILAANGMAEARLESVFPFRMRIVARKETHAGAR